MKFRAWLETVLAPMRLEPFRVERLTFTSYQPVPISVLVNPSLSQALQFHSKTKRGESRSLTDNRGNRYLWDGLDATHEQIIHKLNLYLGSKSQHHDAASIERLFAY